MKFALTILVLICPVLLHGKPVDPNKLPEDRVIALTLLGEARGEGRAGMTAVADVIAWRAYKRQQTPKVVCLAKYQFSFWLEPLSPEKADKLLRSREGQVALELVSLMKKGRLPDIVKGADHYHRISINPKWADKGKRVAIVGNHVFYRLI